MLKYLNSILKSLQAMFMAWLMGIIVVLFVDKQANFEQIAIINLLIGLFLITAWFFFIVPLLSIINKLLKKSSTMRFAFPFLTAIYGILVFAVIFGFIQFDLQKILLIFNPKNNLTLLSTFYGFSFGCCYLFFNRKKLFKSSDF